MISTIYSQRREQAEALINSARTSICTSAASVIQKGDLAATATCLREIDVLRARLHALFEGNVEATKIALRTLYMAEILPLLKQKTLKETSQKILSLNMGMLVTGLGLPPIREEEEIDLAGYENYSTKLSILQIQLDDIKKNNNRTIAIVFREIAYDENGMDLNKIHHHPKNLKRNMIHVAGIDHLIEVFANDLYDPSYVTKQIYDEKAGAVISSSSSDETEADLNSEANSNSSNDGNQGYVPARKKLKLSQDQLQNN